MVKTNIHPCANGVSFELRFIISDPPVAHCIVTDTSSPDFTYRDRQILKENLPADNKYRYVCDFCRKVLEQRYNLVVTWY